MSAASDLELVYRASSQWEATMVEGFLRDGGIACYVRPMMRPGVCRPFVEQISGGWGDILVRPECAAQARAIIREMMPE